MKVSEQIIQVLNALCEKVGLVIDWTGENVVPYLTQLGSRICTYEIATSIFWMIIGVIMIVGSIAYYKHSWKNPIDWDEYYITSKQVHGVISIIFLVVCGIFCTIMICEQTLDIIQAVCLPELTIIDKIKSLTATMSN